MLGSLLRRINQRRKFCTSSSALSRYIKSADVYPVLGSNCFQPKFKNWPELRKQKLTASTFAAAVGFYPRRRVQLWLEKIGAIEPFSGNAATWWSNSNEEEAIERYELITGNTVSLPPDSLVCGKIDYENDWLGASPDGLVGESEGVLEIKCLCFNGDVGKAYPWKRIPLHYIPQAQGLMEILDQDWMHLYVWTANGSSLFRLNRDREYWGYLKIALSDFWWKHVQPAKQLYTESVITDPHSELRSLRPKCRHELLGSLVYASKVVVDNSTLLMREIHGELQFD